MEDGDGLASLLGLDGRMGDVALRVASLGGFEPGDLELGSQRDQRHEHNTTQDAAGRSSWSSISARRVISFTVASKFERELTE